MSKQARGGAFSPAIMIGVILIGVFAFAAFLTLSAFAPELTSGRDGRAHALSQSAVGFAGAVRLARAMGHDVQIGRTLGETARRNALVVLTPQHPLDTDEIEESAGGSTLVILPKWMVSPDPAHRGWVASAGTLPSDAVASFTGEIAPGLTVAQDSAAARVRLTGGEKLQLLSGPIDRLQTIAGPGLTPVLVDERGRIVLASMQRENTAPFYILSDPDFLNTQGLRNIDTARSGMAILDLARESREPIVFDVTLNGLGAARSPLRLAFDPPLLGATLALAIAAALLGWRAAARFGPSAPDIRAIPLGKAALADNSAALIRLWRREKTMGLGYARVIGSQIAMGLSGVRKDEDETASWLDSLAAAHHIKPSFTALLAEAAGAKSRSEMLEAARKLHAWKQEMERATR